MRIPIIGINILTDKSLQKKIAARVAIERRVSVNEIVKFMQLDMKLKERLNQLCHKCRKIMSL